MKKFDKIYLDMDGVLADFDGAFFKLFGQLPRDFEKVHGNVKFWDLILEHRDFFSNLEPFPHLKELVDMCHDMSDKVVILSSPSKFNTALCIIQKREWLDKHDLSHMSAIFEKEKHKFAKPNCLLIDDWRSNIEKWKDKGGSVHHFKSIEKFREFYESQKQ